MTRTTDSCGLGALLSKLETATGHAPRPDSNGNWMAHCPAHDDHRASLSIKEEDGKLLLHCHARCSVEEIVGALGLTMADLFDDRDQGPARKQRRKPAKTAPPKPSRRPDYLYLDADGVELHGTLREPGKRFLQARADAASPTGWFFGLGDIEPVLYGLVNVLAAVAEGCAVWIPEGEKDVERLTSLGLCATTNAGGAGKWRPHYSEALRGADVIVLPDNDKPGKQHAAQVATALHGVADRVRVLELPGLEPKGDVSDWLDAGGTIEQLEALAEAVAEYAPPEPEDPLKQAELLVLEIEQRCDIDLLWRDGPELLAQLGKRDVQRLTARLKKACGAALNLRDFKAAIAECRGDRKQKRERTGPVIKLARQLRDETRDAMELLVAHNEPPVFMRRGSGLCRVTREADGRAVIAAVTRADMRCRLAALADFVVPASDGGMRDVAPSEVLCENVLALGDWPFRALDAVVESPTVRPDGTVLDAPGYDAATRLWYSPTADLQVPPVPPEPTVEQVSQARDQLLDLLADFPFVDASSRANAMAMMLTPLMRPAIAGQVPIALVDSPQAGTGKSLLTELTAVVATGRPAAMITAPRHEEEWGKQITSALLAGATLITIDNVEGALYAPKLAAAITAVTWQDRILGRSEMVTVPQRATWIATGNNISLRGDLPRRCYWLRLDAEMSRPWQRTSFQHADVIQYARQYRGELLGAALTMARGWYAADQPPADNPPTVGGFTRWAETIGGVLAFAGIEGFLGNLDLLYDRVDQEGPEWEVFLTAWHARFADRWVTVAELLQEQSADVVRDAIPDGGRDKDGHPSPRRLGKLLSAKEHVRVGSGNMWLEKGAKGKKGVIWRVQIGNQPLDSDHDEW